MDEYSFEQCDEVRCPIHFRVDFAHVDIEAGNVYLVNYVGDYVVITKTLPHPLSTQRIIALALGGRDRIEYETVIGFVGEGSTSESRDIVSDDDFPRFYEHYDSAKKAVNAHRALTESIGTPLLDLSSPVAIPE